MDAPAKADGARPDPRAIDPLTYLHERYAEGSRRGGPLRAYYAVKPMLPRRLQLAMRRLYARRQARREFPAWPIEPLLVEHEEERLRSAIRASAGGVVAVVEPWPQRLRFAAVLTHDVEGTVGVDNVMRVIEREQRHAFVSSWNFTADWYPIPDGLFDKIRAAGCEIGLHGIKHDGKLFSSRSAFEADLPKIHRCLHAWKAEGFRSPATHRNADWMPELGCLYDSSFPDTDPFEPQSGGCCSILPFMIGDLVELPITLAQDHTLWEILRDESIDVWVRKSEWLIENRGLINVIVHPDYVVDERRLDIYDEFLAYLRPRVDEAAGWHALPRDVAAWWRAREVLGTETDASGAARLTIDGPK